MWRRAWWLREGCFFGGTEASEVRAELWVAGVEVDVFGA